jgi:hypothetical protein
MTRAYARTGNLVALMSVFNDARLIEESMRSLVYVVDEIRIYDGRYQGYRCTCGSEHANSCDETKEAVKRFESETGALIKFKQLPAMHEFPKRQIMFDELKLGDTGLVIDADELFYGDRYELQGFALGVPESRAHCKGGYMYLLGLEAARDRYIRVHVKTPDLRIKSKSGKIDYDFFDDEGEYAVPQMYQFTQARIVHLMSNGIGAGFRPKERDKARFAYDSALMKGQIKP